eukprot:5111876-Prymnesium_polylepis.1
MDAAAVRRSLPATILAHAASEGADRPALEAWDPTAGAVTVSLSWRELGECVVSAAVVLRARGLRGGDYCAFYAHDSAGYVSLSFGAMALGATSVNLNWRQPASTILAVVGDFKPRLLAASKGFRAAAAEVLSKVGGFEMLLIESVCASKG